MTLPTYSEAHRATLMQVAADAVRHGLILRAVLDLDVSRFDAALREPRATFVTLRLHGDLRGCIGVLEPIRPLIADVAQNAYAAAFRDPRFTPVLYHEVDQLSYHISVLSPPQLMTVTDEADLLRQIHPGVDGLILEAVDEGKRGTFLPSVWDTMRDPRVFVQQLKIKAGLPPEGWSPTWRVSRYTTESIS